MPAASIGTATYSCARFADPNGWERGSQSLKAASLANSYRPLECLKGLFFFFFDHMDESVDCDVLTWCVPPVFLSQC